MLRLVDDQHDGRFGHVVQRPERIGQCAAVELADLAGVDFQNARNGHVFQPGGLGGAGDRAAVCVQGAAYGLGDQGPRIAPLIRPKIDVDDDHSLSLQFGLEIGLQKRRFPRSARGGQKQAVVGVPKHVLAAHRLSKLFRQIETGIVEHVLAAFISTSIIYHNAHKSE